MVDEFVAHPRRHRIGGRPVPGHIENVTNKEVYNLTTAFGLCAQWGNAMDDANPQISCGILCVVWGGGVTNANSSVAMSGPFRGMR